MIILYARNVHISGGENVRSTMRMYNIFPNVPTDILMSFAIRSQRITTDALQVYTQNIEMNGNFIYGGYLKC